MDQYSPELTRPELEPREIGAGIETGQRFLALKTEMSRNPRIQLALEALTRTGVNLAVTAVDLGIPLETPIEDRLLAGIEKYRRTPDIPGIVNLAGTLMELGTAGAISRETVNTSYQLNQVDLPRMAAGAIEAGRIVTGELLDWQKNKALLSRAMQSFGVQPPRPAPPHH